jgi:uncharacterized Zn finger protein
VLAEAFDDDPFEMVAWRGRSRSAVLADVTGPPLARSLDGF